ncbi:NIPBL, cohesin loading factor L homeolog isoform X1 [Xenopus laevis]|uniref:Nipped-B protein n=1 Tax=Xenopus laevis TaxID=8355 RepID=A0A8J0UI22_XENLA|nr:NIPBL, cohesin loading factor L homeolog isoform X1 [Xenopus laevis]
MNGDMPHVPITTLAGIASLTDLLNQLPLPSPLPATTTKSLLFNGRIAEEVNCLLTCRDEPLVSQLIHSLNQVSTDHIELKDNLGSDDPEGDIPVLLQATLARNPNVFREKSLQNRYGVQSGLMMPQYKLPQNSMHGSPASSNYQQTTISHSPSSRFVPPQSSSTSRFIGQQNSPVPSPYAPQSPAGYMPYSHPGSYQQQPQGSVSSPIVAGGLRNLHENKVSVQQSGSSTNHHADNSRHGTTEDYLQMVQRLGGEDSDSSIRNAASFSLRSPQSVCSPAGSEGTPKGSRPLILQTQPPPYSSPRDAPPDILLDSPDRKQRRPKKLKLSKDEKEQTEKSAMYDIISSPSKDSTKLTLRLTRVRSSEMDQQGDMLSSMENSNISEGDSSFNVQFPGNASKTPVTPQDLSRPLNAAACFQEQTEFLQVQQVPVLQPQTSAAAKPPQPLVAPSQPQQTGSITPYDEVELDALAEIERIERESAIERERFSKEVQDKDKPLKKRKQDSYPLEAGGATGGNRPASQETGSAGNGSRPALMVSIDLQQAGRGDSQATVTQDSDFARKADDIKNCNDGYISGPQEDTVFKHNPENHPMPLRKTESNMECPDKSVKSTTAKLSTESGLEESHKENKLCDIKSEPVECSEETKVSSDCSMETKSESCETDYDDSMMEYKTSEGFNEGIKTEALLNETSNDVKLCDLQDESKENENQSKSSKVDNRLEMRQKLSTPKQKQSDGQPETPRQKFEGKSEAQKQKVEVKSEAFKQKTEGKPDTIRQKSEGKPDTPKQKMEGHPETPKQKNESKSETPKQKSESKPETPKQKNDGKPETPKQKSDRSETPKQKSESRPDTPKQKSESRPDTPKQKIEGRQDTPRQKGEGRQEISRQKSEEHKSDGRPETPKHKHDMKKDPNRLSTEKKPDLSKHKTDSKCDSPRVKPESRTDGAKQRVDGRPGHESSKRDGENPKQKHDDKGESEKHKGEMSRLRRPESLRSFNKNDQETRPGSKPDTPKMDKAEKKHRHDSDDSREKHSSGEQKPRPGSPRIKQDGKSTPSKSDPSKSDPSKSKSDKPVLKSPVSKDDKRIDVNKSKVEGNKGHSDNKTGFPSYLLGGNQGTLKNFVIPKLKRDKDGNITQESKRSESKGEQKDKPEKMGFVEDLNKGAKPVVVLQKLSLDEVQKLIKERDDKSKGSLKSNKNRPSKSSKGGIDQSVLKELPPELVAEIESSMPLCERVKMNTRKRSTVKEKPKYTEISSGEDEESEETFEPSRKRPKKGKSDADWQYDGDRERRSSGDHRRSGNDSRRGSRYRERSADDSEMEESPPPRLSEVARRLKKERQKKRKAYEPKLTPEELMDSSTFKRFSNAVENILENLEDMDFSAFGDDDEIPQEMLLGKHQLSELGSESAKIKAMGITNKISSEKMVKLLGILEKNIQDGSKLSTMLNHNDTEDEERLWRDLIMERVTKSADACLTAINIMTSPSMPKAVYIEDVIEHVIQYTKFHLQNTLYPQYDPVYRLDPHGGGLMSSKAKRAKCSTHKQRVIVMLYNKICDIVASLSELLEIQLLTDTTILQVSSMGITPFFVENVSELQLCAIKLVTAVFSRYEKHRQLILEELFTSLARLPTSKRSLRNFRLNSSDDDGEAMYIQMVTALVLQLIQCVVHLPSDKDHSEEESNKKIDQDVFITNSYETAMRTAQNFLSIFLKKCGSKQAEEDYRPLFENFVQDLLSTVNKPEWPAAELLLSLLGRLLVHQFSNKSTEMALRVASLDYLGTVAARLRKDAVTSKMDQGSINRILKQAPEGGDDIQQLQKALLDYLEENTETDPSLVFSRKFYIAQWFRDTTMETEKAMKSQKDDDSEGAHHAKEVESTGDIMHRAEKRKKFLRIIIKTAPSQFSTLKSNSDTVDYDDACLIVRYLASMRPFAQSFDIYLTQILRVLGENAIAVRTKAMKCLSEVVAVDPSILARLDMQRGVHGRLMDNSTSVREAAVELLGRFVLCRPQLAEQYYDMLVERILDTGISVRKRVIKILRDICLAQPTFPKITEMCVKMIRRVNDEEGIKKLVNETFQKLWFTPAPQNDKEAMTRKIINITDVVAACKDTGYDWFEQLLQNLLKSEEDASYKPVKKACTQLVDNLVEHILKYEESLADSDSKGVNSGRLVSCITTLFLFSKIRPQLMVKHAMTMQPYLTTKCSTQNDFMVICNVAKILELVVPLMEHPSETFLATMEEDLMKLIIKYGMTVVQHCVSCLGAVVNKATQNYKFVWACFNRYYGALLKLKSQHQEDPNSTVLTTNKPALLRSLFTVGALCRHFDFDQEEFKGSSKVNIKDKVLELLLYFTKHSDEEVQTKAIIGLGFSFIQHPVLMFEVEVKNLYNIILSDKNCSVNLKIQVLKNLQTYLQEEDTRMQQADRDWKKMSKQEDLKEMGDISSGMSSSIMQLYLKQVLESFFSTQSSVRHFALNVIALTLNQGLIHPVQCVPYLIAMGTDPEPSMRNKSDQQLIEIDKKYTGFIHMKAVAGIKMSYQVQQAINSNANQIVRGFRQDESNSALCSHLYSMIRSNRQHRRAFLISLLNLFDDAAKTEVNMLLYIADNLACFPYQSQEEPLFIMHHIDITLSVSGSNLLQSFKESMVMAKQKVKAPSSNEDSSSESDEVSRPKKTRRRGNSESDSDAEDDVEYVLRCLPSNASPLIEFANASQGILLLLMLKQHIKNLCGFSDSKIQKYSPSESAKVYDKAINRKQSVHFHPKQTLEYLKRNMTCTKINDEVKRSIAKQYLDFKMLMEHLDPDEEEEEGEVSASTDARNKAITNLLGGNSPKNNVAETEEEESDGEEKAGGTSGLRKSKRLSDSSDVAVQMNETVDVQDVIAICSPKYKDRPQIAKVVQKTSHGLSIRWMAGSYSGTWAEAKRRDGRKLVPWVDTIKESDIIYKKIALTSANKLTNKVAQTLRSLYAAKDGTSS